MDRLKNIVIGVDFSEFSKIALRQAKRISRWNQSDLDVIHVVDKLVVSELQKAVDSPYQEVLQDVKKNAEERIQALFADDPLDISGTKALQADVSDLGDDVKARCHRIEFLCVGLGGVGHVVGEPPSHELGNGLFARILGQPPILDR